MKAPHYFFLIKVATRWGEPVILEQRILGGGKTGMREMIGRGGGVRERTTGKRAVIVRIHSLT